jgi:hypothetical protein
MGMSARQTPELHHLDVVSKISKKKGKLRTYLLQLSFGLVGGFKDFKKLIARAGLGAQFQDLLFGPTGQVQP